MSRCTKITTTPAAQERPTLVDRDPEEFVLVADRQLAELRHQEIRSDTKAAAMAAVAGVAASAAVGIAGVLAQHVATAGPWMLAAVVPLLAAAVCWGSAISLLLRRVLRPQLLRIDPVPHQAPAAAAARSRHDRRPVATSGDLIGQLERLSEADYLRRQLRLTDLLQRRWAALQTAASRLHVGLLAAGLAGVAVVVLILVGVWSPR